MADPRNAATVAFSGAVLCGGASTRMGRDKALLEITGVSMARRVADALGEAGASQVIAIGGDAEALTAIGLATRADDRPGEGPLPATITALLSGSEAVVMVLACDLLHPSPVAIAATLDALLGEPDAVVAVPLVAGHRQWTHAAWRRSALASLEQAHKDGARSLRRATSRLVIVEVTGIDPASVADADAPGDLP